MKEKQMIIRAITSNKNKTDITVFFYDGSCLFISNSNLQGYSREGTCHGINDADFERAALEGEKILGQTVINYFDLEQVVQSVIQAHIEKKIMK